jgi:hypothetical protein
LAITEEQFQASLHFHCGKESKREKIHLISTSGNHAIFLVVPDKPGKKIHDMYDENDHEFDFGEILSTQRLLHKLTLAELVRLKAYKHEKNKLLEEYMYLESRIEDYFYMKTGMEIDFFKS